MPSMSTRALTTPRTSYLRRQFVRSFAYIFSPGVQPSLFLAPRWGPEVGTQQMTGNAGDLFDLQGPLGRDLRPFGEGGLRNPEPGREPGDEPALGAEKVDTVHRENITEGDITRQGDASIPENPIIAQGYGASDDTEPMTMGRIIRNARQRRDLKQADLARRLGVRQSAVSQWESGKKAPELDTRIRLSAMLGIPLNELLPKAPEIPPEALEDAQVKRVLANFLTLDRDARNAADLLLLRLAEAEALKR